MDEPQPGPSNVQVPIIMNSDEDSIPFADSPETPPKSELRKASGQQQIHDGIILLITSDTESQRSPNGSLAQHPLSEFYLLPLPQDALGANRRYSLQDRGDKKHHHPERKASCPDAELQLSPDSRRSRKSDLDRLTPTSFSSRRSSNASTGGHSRRSSNCSLGHRRRSSTCCSRRSSNSSVSHSRRSSSASHHSHRSSPSHSSRRSSNCSRRSSHLDSDEEYFLHHAHHSHHHCHRGSRASMMEHRGSNVSIGGVDTRRGSRLPSPLEKKELDEREELEMGGIPLRHRRIIIMIIGSVSIFILVMSVVLIAVSLTLSPTIDDLVRKGNEDIYRSMSAGASTSSPTTDGAGAVNSSTPSSGTPG